MQALAAAGLENVRLFTDDALKLLMALPDASIDAVYLLYPDPWPKRRQRKRRFVSDAALAEIGENTGTSYDGAVVAACLRLFRERGFRLGEL